MAPDSYLCHFKVRIQQSKHKQQMMDEERGENDAVLLNDRIIESPLTRYIPVKTALVGTKIKSPVK